MALRLLNPNPKPMQRWRCKVNIKFRAFDKISKSIFSVSDINFYLGTINSSTYYKPPSPMLCFEDIELMQFIGLTDKNGKEIYEGDIVRYDSEDGIITGEIFFDENKDYENIPFISGFRVKVIKTEDYPEGEEDNPVEFEIIGNKFENPELLDGGIK